MNEEQAAYDAGQPRRSEVDDVEHIGDVIQQMIEDGPWRHLAPAIRTNGNPGTRTGRRDHE